MGVRRENHLTHPQAELVLSHMLPVRGSNLHQTQRRDDRMIKSAEIQRRYPLGHGGRLAIFSTLSKIFKRKLQGSEKYILKAKSNFTLFIFEYIYTRSDSKQMEHCH